MKEDKSSKSDKIDNTIVNVNKENLDKVYEEPQIDEEKFMNKKKLDSEDIKTAKINKENLDKDYEEPQMDEEKMRNKGNISKENEMLKCPHQTETRVCDCSMNCDCKRTGRCKDLRNVEDVKDERYDTAGKSSVGDKSNNLNEKEGVWDRTKNEISAGIEKAKKLIPKF